MAANKEQLEIEIGVEPGNEAFAAYSDQVLDAAIGLRLEHATGALTAVIKDGRGRRQLACGSVSRHRASLLRPFSRVIWARVAPDDAIAVAEIALEHV